ncbi:hypothetical protein ACM26V_14755 [Salipaludibacillus sp. HK11]|uniref:hypothetical protein n=1 Tax=Salipaludibacillus sp. HK11 TaxID=3394320 RepID=UPI0039FB9636
MRNRMRRRRLPNHAPLLIMGGAGFLIMIIIFVFISHGPEEKIVNKFYQYEQDQEFWNSYELFHPQMKERFSRSKYINQRSHIFVDHFDVDTYDLEVGNSKKIKNWQMSEEQEPLTDVYEIPVTKTYQSQFGEFSINQNVYAVKEDGEWYMMWDYHY